MENPANDMKFSVEKEMKEIPEILEKRRQISLKDFSSLLEEPILVTGISSSIDMPGFGVEKLADELGINLKARYAPEASNVSANTVIALSFSGETESTVDVLKNSKAKIKIAVTGNENSSIAKHATHVIPLICGKQISDVAAKSVAEQFYILNQLISEKFGNYVPITSEEIGQIKNNLNIEFTNTAIDKFLKTKRVVLIGSRGFSEEMKTKFHEITRIPAEVVLGPVIFYSDIEVLTQGDMILVIEPEKMKDYEDALEKTARVNDIVYIDKLGIDGAGCYKPLIRYVGMLNLVSHIGKAKNIDIDHPEILMRTVRGFRRPLFNDVKKVVVIGGGSGVPPLIKSFKSLGHNVSGITSMVDNGGSAGKLRRDYKVLPPGDIRRIIAALSDHPNAKGLINFRFKGGDLDGHTFGNIMIAALERFSSFEYAKEEVEKILGTKGRAYPATIDDCHIYAELENGQILMGEDQIDVPLRNPFLKIKKVWLEPQGKIFSETRKAIMDADIIVIGPGDLYSSLIPSLLVSGVSEAIRESKAKKFFIVNSMEKLGETIGYDVSKFTEEIEKYLGNNVLDYVIYNHRIPSKERIMEYQKEEPFVFDYVKFDREKLNGREKPKTMGFDLLVSSQGPIIHDPNVLSKTVLSLA